MGTPQNILDTMVWGGQTADIQHPGLRERDAHAWMAFAASYAASRDPLIGRKARSAGARVSPDTMAYSLGAAGMYCVSIIRDEPGVNPWRAAPEDHGLVLGQHFIAVTPVDPAGTGPPEPPPATDLEGRVAKLEAWARSVAFRG